LNVSENDEDESPPVTVHFSATLPITLTVPVTVCAEAAPAKAKAASAVAEINPTLIFHSQSIPAATGAPSKFSHARTRAGALQGEALKVTTSVSLYVAATSTSGPG